MKNRPLIDCLMRLMMIIVINLMIPRIHGGCIEEERKALLEIKASLKSYGGDADRLLRTWSDGGGECCDWERVKCNTTTGHVTDLPLENLRDSLYYDSYHKENKIWELNVSVFLHFKELRNLNLAFNLLDNGIDKTGIGRLSSLKKLEMLNLSGNRIENSSIFRSLGALTSLKILDLSDNYFMGEDFPAHELAALENLEMLDLTYCGFYGTIVEMQGLERLSGPRKLEILNLGFNNFNERILPSLSALPSLKVLNLEWNVLSGSFPAKELAHLKSLENLDLSGNWLNDTSTIQDCKRLSSLKRLKSIALGGSNMFNKSIISCLSSLPSLKILDLHWSNQLGNSIPVQELSVLKELTTLDLSNNNLDSLEFNGTMSSLVHLNLDGNNFRKEILRSFVAFPSLKFLSLANCGMEGVISAEDLPKLPNLGVLILQSNSFNGTLPMKGLAYYPHLEVLDLSGNMFVGSIPSSIEALSSLKVLSLAQNDLNGSLPLPGFCKLTNLHELDLSQNKFEGDLPPCFSSLSSLKLFDLSLNQFSGNIPSSLISNLTSLEYVDLSHNKFEGLLSMGSFYNHTKLEVVEFISDNDKFEVETQEPLDCIPMFQLKVLVLSNCNLKSSTGVPGFLLHQHKLQIIDLSHNSLGRTFPNWLIENNTRLEYFNLRNNSFGGTIRMSPYQNVNTGWLDMSGNHLTGTIPPDIGTILPYITNLNLSRNSLDGALPLSMGNLSEIRVLDLSNNSFSGEVPKRLLTGCPSLTVLQLSNNKLDGEVLSRKFNTSELSILLLDNNRFTGVLTIEITDVFMLGMLDISGNLFSGVIPGWISNLTSLNALVIRNNMFEGQFPCGTAPFLFLDISHNSFSGSVPSCLNLQSIRHLHLDSNRFTGPIPESFRNLTGLVTLDMGNNKLSGRIPMFLGELSGLRILFLRRNNFSGSIPKQLCRLSNVSLIDLSSNSLSGSIPNCLQNITGPRNLAFLKATYLWSSRHSFYKYGSILERQFHINGEDDIYERQDEVQFITKGRPDTYKGGILDYMSGLDLSCNNLTGGIPQELGLLTHILAMNLSHNQLTGPIPSLFSNLDSIESLDMSSNCLSGEVPQELTRLNFLAVFIVANNNLSGRLPEMKGQFGTFTANSYEDNPFLCGPPLEKKCSPNSTFMTPPLSAEENEVWYHVDMVSFGASLISTWFVVLMGFAGVLCVNHRWRRRWFVIVERCMYTSYYFVCDCLRKHRF